MRAVVAVVGIVVGTVIACGARGLRFGDGDGGSDGAPDDVTPPTFNEAARTTPARATRAEHPGGTARLAQYIYITGQGAQLWSFWPPTFTFKLVGALSCTTSRRT